ncbi:MAG TPA: hypothetical protein DHW14_05125, partial [Clostridiales bacterium]|nr:hypothetical protein [Clostridiales bacterium]
AGSGAAVPSGRPPVEAGAQAASRPKPEVTGGERVEAPLPGTVVAVRVRPGQEVRKGEVLVVLEAMKMENEVVAPRGGIVRDVPVEKGDTVSLGDVLVTLE